MHARMLPLLCGSLVACVATSQPQSSQDAGTPDLADAGTPDMRTPDLGALDLGSPDQGTSDAGAQRYTLTVNNGEGSGEYPAGARVHISASLDWASQLLLEWRANVNLNELSLDNPKAWQTTLVMPAQNVSIEAILETATQTLTESTFTGVTQTEKRALLSPASGPPKGVILFLHGTGGSADFLRRSESVAFSHIANQRGYALVSADAEEVIAGDLDDDQKIRWDATLSENNLDLGNLNALLEDAQQSGNLPAGLPRFVMGMSNGGAFSLTVGAVAQTPELAMAFPALRFVAAASYCASGRRDAAEQTTTPTAWYLCRNDTNPNVGAEGNARAEERSGQLAQRSIPTEVRYHEPSPVTLTRLLRVTDLDAPTAQAVLDELQSHGFLDAQGFLTAPVSALVQAIQSAPRDFPAITGLPGPTGRDLSDQLSVAYADHKFFSELAHRTLDFFEAQRP